MANTTEIKSTTDYSMFKGVVGNRKLYRRHLANLTKAIAKKNMLDVNPIIINERGQVIDGQHRLEVAKANNLPIFYTVLKQGNLEDIQELNATSKNWSAADYLASYASLGIKEYAVIQDLLTQGVPTINNALIILTGGGGTGYHQFKRGKLRITNEDYEDTVAAYIAIRPHAALRAWKDREFLQALIHVLRKVDIATLTAKLETYGTRIEPQITVKDYLREFEEVINFRAKGSALRLY
jgi:hypothetical protein